MTVRVLVVEDEAFAAKAHAAHVTRVDGFEVAGITRSARETMAHLGADPAVDLVLLDLNLPDGHGLGLLRTMRGQGHLCDVIAVTSARDLDVVRQAVAQGVVSYLLKPFTFAGLRAKLEQYAMYRDHLAKNTDDLAQHEVDQVLGMLRPFASPEQLPKGMSAGTMTEVTEAVHQGGPRSASEVAESIGSSRVTARRYLEHLADVGVIGRRTRYGGTGRPEIEYRWLD